MCVSNSGACSGYQCERVPPAVMARAAGGHSSHGAVSVRQAHDPMDKALHPPGGLHPCHRAGGPRPDSWKGRSEQNIAHKLVKRLDNRRVPNSSRVVHCGMCDSE